MSQRGHVLSLVMMAMLVGVVTVGVFATRASVLINARKDDTKHQQAEWLARSACLSGVSQSLTLKQPAARIKHTGTTVFVELEGATVALDCSTGRAAFSR